MLAALLASLLTLAPPPDSTLAALYGGWETLEATSRTVVLDDGTRLTVATRYRAFHLAADAVTTTEVAATTADRPGFADEPRASEQRSAYRADGLTLTFPDGARAHLRPDGDRLGVTWVVADSARAEVLHSRQARPHPLAGRWGITSVDEAGVPVFLTMTVSADGRVAMPGEASLGDAWIAGGYLIHGCESAAGASEADRLRGCDVTPLRKRGRRIVLDGDGNAWMTRL